ncbi:hypothetical protein M407DRAFT_244107 [Tulasnella calospora MUT 4182]|uniref:Copper transport protein n=1 Tax=Tulasnella calospora MUT 4182 TaxID=1051891 RepID=A0A0C3Q725_9AGAM|nr:hypothetical protein M407DRAFT_244107 [Tulasnella calospora MUT 4182]
MDHSHHHDMGSMDTEARCKIHMLWNWETIDSCVVFRSWHVHNMFQFVITCLIIVLIGVAFEWLRKVQKRYDYTLSKGPVGAPGTKRSRSPPPASRAGAPAPDRLALMPRLIRASLYSLLVFISFFIMLIFMTYNGYLVLSVVAGAFIGHFLLNSELAVDDDPASGGAIGSNGMACH